MVNYVKKVHTSEYKVNKRLRFQLIHHLFDLSESDLGFDLVMLRC